MPDIVQVLFRERGLRALPLHPGIRALRTEFRYQFCRRLFLRSQRLHSKPQLPKPADSGVEALLSGATDRTHLAAASCRARRMHCLAWRLVDRFNLAI